jgi:hypothetical protein
MFRPSSQIMWIKELDQFQREMTRKAVVEIRGGGVKECSSVIVIGTECRKRSY